MTPLFLSKVSGVVGYSLSLPRHCCNRLAVFVLKPWELFAEYVAHIVAEPHCDLLRTQSGVCSREECSSSSLSLVGALIFQSDFFDIERVGRLVE